MVQPVLEKIIGKVKKFGGDGAYDKTKVYDILEKKNSLPIELICSISFKDKYKAYDFERYLKSGSGKAFAKKKLF